MNVHQALWLGHQNIRRTLRSFLLSMAGVALGITVMTFFIALALGVKKRVIAELSPPGRLEVIVPEPEGGAGGVLAGLFSDKRELTEDVVKQLRQHPDVEAVYPRMKTDFPVSAWTMTEKLLGAKKNLQLPMEGLDPKAISQETFPLPFADLDGVDRSMCYEDADCERNNQQAVVGLSCTLNKDCPLGSTCNSDKHTCSVPPSYCEWDIHQCKRPIPLLISPFLIDLYNGWFSKPNGLPKIGSFEASFMRGLQVGAHLRSHAGQKDPIQRRLMLVGVSDRAPPVGVAVPLPYVQRWNRQLVNDQASKVYSSLWVDVKPDGSITKVVAEIRRLGFDMAKNGVDQVALAITLMMALFVVISFGIIVLSIFNIAQAFLRAVSERRKEMGVMRALGASAWDLQKLLWGEAASVGLMGGVVGLLSGWLISLVVDVLAAKLLPDFPHKPSSFFYFSPLLCLGALVLATFSCVLGAYWPARAAAKLSPAEVLSGS